MFRMIRDDIKAVFERDPADQHVSSVTDAIDIVFEGILEEPVDQDRMLGGHVHRFGHVFLDSLPVIADLHGAAAKNIRWPDEYGISYLFCDQNGLCDRVRRSIRRVGDIVPAEQCPESFAVLGQVDPFGGGTQDGHAIRFETPGDLQGRLTAKTDDHAIRPFVITNAEDVFERQRLEIELVRRVIVGRDGLRITIHHDCFHALFLERIDSMDAAIVELDSLADPVRPPPENDDLLPV